MKFCNLGNGNMLMICKIEIYILQIISIFPFRNITDFHFVSFLKLQQAVVCLMISVLSYVMTLGEPPCLITWAENDDAWTVLSAKQGLPLLLYESKEFCEWIHEVSCVRCGAPGNPGGKKKLLRFYSFNDLFKLHYFLSICQLSAASERRKKLRYLFLCRPILSGKKNLSLAALCDPWVFSSRLEFTVVYGVIFRSGYTVTTFSLC